VVAGTAPPPSRVPSVAAGTAVDPKAVRFPEVKGLALPAGANTFGPPADWIDPPGSSTQAFIMSSLPERYGIRVPAVDADGNETAGIRLPDIAVPLATYTGWNLYKAAEGELCDRDGSYMPFAKTKEERETFGDPRLSIAERYLTRADYVAKVKAAADALVGNRLLLPEDAERYVRAAEQSDRF
jgi:hypothetical protein